MDVTDALARLGFEDNQVAALLKKPKLAEITAQIAAECAPGVKPQLVRGVAEHIVKHESDRELRGPVVAAVSDGRLQTQQQVDAAWEYVVRKKGEAFDETEFDRECGVGVVITDSDVEREVHGYLSARLADLETQRYKLVGPSMAAVKQLPSLKWANPASFKPILDREFARLIGPKDDRDNVKLQNKAKKKKETPVEASSSSPSSIFTEGFLGNLHKPGGNEQESPELMQKHLAFTKGRVFTRFPPEPNGFLHIGHAKSIAINFGYAAFHKGECYLRFDDTNPEAEDERYSQSIVEIVKWLGFTPYRITWSSDYFDELYMLAERLIESGLGYVCFCTPEQMRKHRGIKDDGTPGGERSACEHRSQRPDEALALFRRMRAGEYEKGKATLRMKMDLESANPQMWDLVAYRIVNAPHHRTGNAWKIYPTYDFTHCLVDSLENISHSLCTMEFRLSRESYEWLCDAVRVYKPAQREFGRLNLEGAIMSKRKILQLVNGKHVRDWDDPRLYTLVALRRRGVPPGAILSFVSELGVSTATTTAETSRFENSVRRYLEHAVPRLMMVLDPVKVTIVNLPDDHRELVDVPFKPGVPSMGTHKLPFTSTLYIDRSDFRSQGASESFYRLVPGGIVGLLHAPGLIRAVDFESDAATGEVVEIKAELLRDAKIKPKTYIQWVGQSTQDNSPVRVAEVREFERLFKSDNPSGNPGGFLADLNPNSERVWPHAMVEAGFHEVRTHSPWADNDGDVLSGHDEKGAPEAVRFQALRVGYYCMDKDSSGDRIVLNRTVTLREDPGK